MDEWEWKLRAEISNSLKVFSGYGNDVFFPEATKNLIQIFRKYAVLILNQALERELHSGDKSIR